MHIVELKEKLQDTSFEEDMFYNSKLLKHINSFLDNEIDISVTSYKYVSSLASKISIMLDQIDYVIRKGGCFRGC